MVDKSVPINDGMEYHTEVGEGSKEIGGSQIPNNTDTQTTREGCLPLIFSSFFEN